MFKRVSVRKIRNLDGKELNASIVVCLDTGAKTIVESNAKGTRFIQRAYLPPSESKDFVKVT